MIDYSMFSPNLGIKEKHFDRNSLKYAELNGLLKSIYMHFCPFFVPNEIYAYLLRINQKVSILSDVMVLKSDLGRLVESSSNWKNASIDMFGGYWVQALYIHKDDDLSSYPCAPENIKVYACMKTTDVQIVFVDSLKYLLERAGNSFGAKVATCSRADQMCYWLSQNDFKHLEDFYKMYDDNLDTSMPFVAYKGKLGISKDFPGVDPSHNVLLVDIIVDYLNTVNNVDDVDIEDMFNNYIAKWNGEVEEETMYGFREQTALSFVVILDTMDAILDGTGITEHSLLTGGEKKMWNLLARSRSWDDVKELRRRPL